MKKVGKVGVFPKFVLRNEQAFNNPPLLQNNPSLLLNKEGLFFNKGRLLLNNGSLLMLFHFFFVPLPSI